MSSVVNFFEQSSKSKILGFCILFIGSGYAFLFRSPEILESAFMWSSSLIIGKTISSIMPGSLSALTQKKGN